MDNNTMKWMSLLIAVVLQEFCLGKLTLSTYNIWNVMFRWDVRKYRIARMIREMDVDIIGLQEVRFTTSGHNQVLELQSLLPKHQWAYYKEVNNVTMREDSIFKVWTSEGLAILSKLPIISSSTFHMPYNYGPDTNRRIGLHVKVQLETGKTVDVIVLHFSYDRQQQCTNAAAVLDFIHYKRLSRVIIMGDFNTYQDFEMPVKLFTHIEKMTLGKCRSQLKPYLKKAFQFRDAWTAVHERQLDLGLTFSNMPHPGLESRPDRILFGNNMKIDSAVTSGDGKFYRDHYSNSIIFNRFSTVMYNSYLSHNGTTGYSCIQDCGPHGSCRCGVCVMGGNQNGCLLPECEECNSHIYTMYLLFKFISCVLAIHLLYSIVTILVTGSDFKREEIFSILGCNCCLCNKNMYSSNFSRSRRHRFFRFCHKWPLFRLPPYLLCFCTILCIFITFLSAKNVFHQTLNTIYAVMKEEYFPSDHLMLTIQISV